MGQKKLMFREVFFLGFVLGLCHHTVMYEQISYNIAFLVILLMICQGLVGTLRTLPIV